MEKLRDGLVRQLLFSQQQIREILVSVADDPDWQPRPDRWSFRYIAAHLAVVEGECFLQRLRLLLAGGNPRFEYYSNDGRDFSHEDLRNSLQVWLLTREAFVHFVKILSDERLLLNGTHATFGEMTVLDLLQLMLDHDQEHLQELRESVNLYRQETLKKRCYSEVVELHRFFQDWFNGKLPVTDENFARCTAVLGPDFALIGPDGASTLRQPLINGLKQAHNSRSDFRIWIKNFEVRQLLQDVTLATYEEWQQTGDSAATARLSTVLFREKTGTPNGVEWLHVHETWLAAK